jgi:hypothetical protein
MYVDCVNTSLRIAQVDPDDEPLPEVVLSHCPHLSVTLHIAMVSVTSTSPWPYLHCRYVALQRVYASSIMSS